MSLGVRTDVLLALLAAALGALVYAGLLAYRARRSAREWREHFYKVERAMLALPRMQPVLAALPRCEEVFPLVGVIVELRSHPNLAPVIGKIRTILPGMPIRIFHGIHNREFVEQVFRREIERGEIRLVALGLEHFSVECYNWLMTSARFYEACDARHLLVFQTDAVLFARSRVKLEEFLRYDYVGARWQLGGEWSFRLWSSRALPEIGNVGNGGLSLRRRAKMIQAATAVPYLSTPFVNEDVHFAHALRKVGASFPTLDQCDRFSFEEVLGAELPFGAHKFMPPRYHDQILADERAVLRDPS